MAHIESLSVDAGQPLQGMQQHGLEAGIEPGLHPMPERGVEHATLAVITDPGQREVSVVSGDARRAQVDRAGVQRHQNAHTVAREVAELVDLVGDAKRWSQIPHDGMVRVLDLD